MSSHKPHTHKIFLCRRKSFPHPHRPSTIPPLAPHTTTSRGDPQGQAPSNGIQRATNMGPRNSSIDRANRFAPGDGSPPCNPVAPPIHPSKHPSITHTSSSQMEQNDRARYVGSKNHRFVSPHAQLWKACLQNDEQEMKSPAIHHRISHSSPTTNHGLRIASHKVSRTCHLIYSPGSNPYLPSSLPPFLHPSLRPLPPLSSPSNNRPRPTDRPANQPTTHTIKSI